MDRRHVVLCVAVGAALADNRVEPPSLFRGNQSWQVDPFWLDEAQPIRTWLVTMDVVLPSQAADHDFISSTGLEAWFVDQDNEHDPVVFSLAECDADVIEQGTLDSDLYVALSDTFAGCAPEEQCTRTFCVEFQTSNDQVAVEVEWFTWGAIESDATVDYDGESIPVPIDITIEETEP